ncbi:hypothetical protein GCM10027277_12020 [Pseudoduganella ginsengisoli]
MCQQAGGRYGAHTGRPCGIERIGNDFTRIGGTARAREDHALGGIAQAVAKEGCDAGQFRLQAGGQRAPDGGLLCDFLSGGKAANIGPALPAALQK